MPFAIHKASRINVDEYRRRQWWVNQNCPKILAKRGYSASAVDAACRFYNGQLTPKEFFPLYMKFNSAYYYHSFLWVLARGLFSGHMMKTNPEALIFGYRQLLNNWSVMDRLSEIQVPALVLAGRYDFLFPTEHQVALAAGIPDARLEVIENAGHAPHMEQQAEVVRIIKSFIAETKLVYA